MIPERAILDAMSVGMWGKLAKTARWAILTPQGREAVRRAVEFARAHEGEINTAARAAAAKAREVADGAREGVRRFKEELNKKPE
ncbi:MAG: hypothetical protein HY804_12850 [Nitrospinae bacterium]|nr:hypothetical protein [Nitrospinota bacterium]